jgi:hypothetical protein
VADWGDLSDDLAAEVAGSDLGQAASITPASTGVAELLSGLFRRRTLEVLADAGPAAIVQTSTLRISRASLSVEPRRGDAVTVGGQSWTIQKVIIPRQSIYDLTLSEVA